jgi:tungstate transport system ATP-binding protein
MNQPSLYQLTGVTKGYGGPPVLQLDHLEVFSGEVLCLVGPTGSGKSTFLRLLSTLESPTGGELQFADQRINGKVMPLETQRRVTLVFQRPVLLSGTVRANVEYGLRLRGSARRWPLAEQVLEDLGLAGLAGRSARTLSGGETQLVALARALVLEPEVLLLDEPTANLDPARVARVEEVVTRVNRQHQTTVVWATHNIFQARRVAHRVALLLDGRLVELATARDFFEAPRDPRTAAFIRGEMVY